MADGVQTPISAERVREELARVLNSHEFRSSKRSQDFLRFVVEHALAGDTDILKERTIGIEVFGRPTTYDPSDDATVRVKAGEVRKRLGLYYSDQGSQDPIRIELPSGTYVPEFRLPVGAAAPPPEPPRAPEPTARPRRVPVLAGVLLLVLAGLATWYFGRPANTVLDQFWAPVLDGKQPVQVCAAFVPVWNYEASGGPPRPEDYVPLNDQFVGGGDLQAVSRLSSMLTRLKRPYRVRVGNDVAFADLRNG